MRSTTHAEAQEHAAAEPPKHRRRRGLTQRQLSGLAGVAHTTVQRLEFLERGAYPQTLRKLAVALRVEPEALVGGGQQ